jgi:predicted MPP superfamily phosphohydrolase
LINHHEAELELLAPALERLRSPLGVFAVPGNHDYVGAGRIERWEAYLEARGVRVLRNRGVRLTHRGGPLWLCGVDDLTEGEPRLAEALAGRRVGEPSLLLSHHPDLFLEASARGVDLQLSGHTHGGQVRFFGWAPMHHSRHGWVNGLYERGASRLYVGRGAGVTALPIRIGTRSEITLLRPRGP